MPCTPTHKLRAALLAFAFASTLAGEPAPGAVQAQIRLVTGLYQAFAWEAVVDEPSPGSVSLLEQPRPSLLRYFTPSLVDLLLRDRASARKTHSIGNLDFQPIWDAQDASGTTVHVSPGEAADVVIVHLDRCGQETELTYRLVHAGHGWRIADILYGSGHPSLADILKTKR